MDLRLLLAKIITLIYRSRLNNNLENDDLIRTILNTIKIDGPEFSTMGHTAIKQLRNFTIELLEQKDNIACEVIIQRVSIILENDEKLLKVIRESIEQEYDEASNKRVTTSLVKMLNNYYKEALAIDLINKISCELKFNRAKIPNFTDYLKNVISQLEPLSNSITSIRDPGMISEIDFENSDNLNTVFEEVKSINNKTGIYITGWQDLNIMLQGGIRRGEFITIGALQHKYKTGFSLSLFMQIARLNKPIVLNNVEPKKPLLLRISFEDSLMNNMQFMYQYLRVHDDNGFDAKELEELSPSELSKYCVDKLTATGFHIKMMRVDPGQWTYLNIINKIIELEAQGYEIHVLMLDYLTLLPTTGCTAGTIGSDKKDLVRRIRNFCSGRNIATITPIQLSSEAKMLIRSGVPEHQFLEQIAERGYYEGCKSMDTDIDCELFIHLFGKGKQKYLAVRRGKHRIPTVIEDIHKQFFLQFRNIDTPLIEDINGPKTSMPTILKIPSENSIILDDILS